MTFEYRGFEVRETSGISSEGELVKRFYCAVGSSTVGADFYPKDREAAVEMVKFQIDKKIESGMVQTAGRA